MLKSKKCLKIIRNGIFCHFAQLNFHRTRCADENEEEITENEIEMMFPNYASTDFGEFIELPSLETTKKEPTPQSKPPQDLLTDDDLRFIGDMFIDTMFKYSRYELRFVFR